MFTGLVEEIGRVRQVRRQGNFQRLTIDAARILDDLQIGDSVDIAGACQTVVDLDGSGFAVESVEETLRRTTLGELRVGDAVNLERALRAGDRLGGHLVQGHVDGVGRISGLAQGSGSWELSVEPASGLERYIASKGSITVDGISLTVVEADDRHFTVAVIPHTFEHTTLAERRVGDRVNLEVDVIARYVDRLLSGGESAAGGLTLDQMRNMGY